jgi:hypothetical protein
MDKRDVAGLHRIEIRREMAGRQPLHHHRARAPALIGETMAQVDRGGDMFYAGPPAWGFGRFVGGKPVGWRRFQASLTSTVPSGNGKVPAW